MAPLTNKRWPRWWRQVQIRARRANFFAIMEIASVAAFAIMTGVTWLAISHQSARAQLLPSDLTATLLVGTLVPAMAILVLLGRRIALQRAAEVAGGGGQLHVRLVFLFSLISAIPTLLVVVFASWLFQSGVEFWFSDNSRGLLENANKLARGYYEQTQRDMEYESLAMAADLRDELTQVPMASAEFQDYYLYQVLHRKINESTILQKGTDGQLHKAAFTRGEAPLSEISGEALRQLDQGTEIVVSSADNSIKAVTPIDRRVGIYLYTARKSDLLSSGYAQNIVRAYDELTRRARILQLRFNVGLFIASLALVGLAVWFGLRFADRQVKPLHGLVDAARHELPGEGHAQPGQEHAGRARPSAADPARHDLPIPGTQEYGWVLAGRPDVFRERLDLGPNGVRVAAGCQGQAHGQDQGDRDEDEHLSACAVGLRRRLGGLVSGQQTAGLRVEQ